VDDDNDDDDDDVIISLIVRTTSGRMYIYTFMDSSRISIIITTR
jgi:hypothetical protein